MNKQLLIIFVLSILFSSLALNLSNVEAAVRPDLQALTTQQKIVVLVEKSANKMTVFYQGKPLNSFLCVSGVNPQGDKQKQGDNRTPEGQFFITEKERLNDHPYLGRKWLGLSYPTPVHAQKGLENNLISSDQYNDIVQANIQTIIPPQNTALGGWIGIHGGREDLTKKNVNWTEGCIALQDADLEVLYDMVQYGTPVIIVP